MTQSPQTDNAGSYGRQRFDWEKSRMGSARRTSVSLMEWIAVIAIGVFALSSAIACWMWLNGFPIPSPG